MGKSRRKWDLMRDTGKARSSRRLNQKQKMGMMIKRLRANFEHAYLVMKLSTQGLPHSGNKHSSVFFSVIDGAEALPKNFWAFGSAGVCDLCEKIRTMQRVVGV